MTRHALIIEDEILIAFEVQGVLEELGFDSFDLACSPTEALALAQAHRPDLITADLRIVGGTGLEAVEAITEQMGPIPVVYVTANADLLRGHCAPAVVEKPIAWPVLADACNRVCGLTA
ncbi:response regulator [Phenylobacterium sp.]|jgi:CheY-like chemotaxis protein|uniref:response regulator n=1 Tax=Phenylobacterium sp. TaxID=1871053 RepID=UPI002F3EAF62